MNPKDEKPPINADSDDERSDELVNTKPPTEQKPPPPDPVESIRTELLYLRAEFENYKKRMIREQELAIRFANEKLVVAMIDVADHLERALSHAGKLKSNSESNVIRFISGIEMTYREMIQAFEKFGVEFTGSIGEPFDPQKEEAVSHMDAPEESVDKVIEVIQRGCLLNGRLLKPAKVVVGRKKEI